MKEILEKLERLKSNDKEFINTTNQKTKDELNTIKKQFLNNNLNFINNSLEDNLNENYYFQIKQKLDEAIDLKNKLSEIDNKITNSINMFINLFEENLNKYISEKSTRVNFYDFNKIESLIEMVQLTNQYVVKNKNILLSNSNIEKECVLSHIKKNFSLISDVLNENKAFNNELIINVKNIFNQVYTLMNSINLNTKLQLNEINKEILYISLANNIDKENNINNSKIWKIIYIKKGEKIYFSKFKFNFHKNLKINKNYCIHLIISDCKDLKVITNKVINFIKKNMMEHYIIYNDFCKKKVNNYNYIKIFGIGKLNFNIIKHIKKFLEKCKIKFLDSEIIIKITLYNKLDILIKKNIRKVVKAHIEENNNIEQNNLNDLLIDIQKKLIYNFSEKFISYYFSYNNLIKY